MGGIMDSSANHGASGLVEGVAHVVALEGDTAWLAPEQGAGCGGCPSAPTCGSKAMNTASGRLEARRFQLVNDAGLRIGDRVVVGVRENTVLRASMTAYMIPLATLLISGTLAESIAGDDFVTVAVMLAGLALGLWLARLCARRLTGRGELTPRFIRHADMDKARNS